MVQMAQMKLAIVLLWAACGLCFCVGCRCPCKVDAHSPATYVRDPYHHCVEVTDPDFSKDTKMVGEDGQVSINYGWRNWHCDDGVHVVISNDEAQP